MELKIGDSVKVRLNVRENDEIVPGEAQDAKVLAFVKKSARPNNKSGENLIQVELKDGTKVAVQEKQIETAGDKKAESTDKPA